DGAGAGGGAGTGGAPARAGGNGGWPQHGGGRHCGAGLRRGRVGGGGRRRRRPAGTGGAGRRRWRGGRARPPAAPPRRPEPPPARRRRGGTETTRGGSAIRGFYASPLPTREPHGARAPDADSPLRDELQPLPPPAARFREPFAGGFFARPRNRLGRMGRGEDE